MRRLGLAIAIGLGALAACFTDSKPATDDCPAGGPGCACRAGESCDAGLECLEPGVCVRQSCTPGMAGCLCDDGACAGDLVCNELGACVDRRGSESDTSTNAGSGSHGGTSATTTSTTTSTTITSGMSTTMDASTGTPETTGPDDTCLQCVQGTRAEACASDFDCAGSCPDVVECLVDCHMGGLAPVMCAAKCCETSEAMTKAYLECIKSVCRTCPIPTACYAA